MNKKKIVAKIYYDFQNHKEILVSENDEELLLKPIPQLQTKDEYYTNFEKRPKISENQRKLPAEVRYQLVNGLNDFLIGRSFGYLVESQVYMAMKKGYELSVRNEIGGVSFYSKKEGDTTAFILIGPSGSGKTTILNQTLVRYPRLIEYSGENYKMIQIPYIKVDCPANASMKSFYNRCIDEISNIVGEENIGTTRRMNLDDIRNKFVSLARRFNLGLLVIDELQNIIGFKAKEQVLRQFLNLSNELRVPIIYVGTNELKKYFESSEFYNKRRLGIEINITSYNNDIEWDVLIENLWKYHWTKEYIPLTEEIKNTLYKESGGIIDRVIQLYKTVQMQAILNGIDDATKLTPKYIKRISQVYYSMSRDGLLSLSDDEKPNYKILEPDLRMMETNYTDINICGDVLETEDDAERDGVFLKKELYTKDMAKNEVISMVKLYSEANGNCFNEKEVEAYVEKIFKHKRKVKGKEREYALYVIKALSNVDNTINDNSNNIGAKTKVEVEDLPRYKGGNL